MTYWVKFVYERETYVVDLEQIGAFSRSPNGKLTFWLPNSRIPIIIHPQSNPEAYHSVLDYLKKTIQRSWETYWVKINYDREEYQIDLKRISSFSCSPNSGKVVFSLPDSGMQIVIHPQSNPEDYYKVIAYVKQTTGYQLDG